MNTNTASAAQIAQMMDGQVISGISGTLTNIYPRKNGTGEHGEWSFQNAKLQDDNGALIDIQFKDRPEIPQDLKGSYIAIMSNTTDKGTHGVKVYDDEYPQGTVTRKLRVTKSASFSDVKAPDEASQIQHDEPFDEMPQDYGQPIETPQEPIIEQPAQKIVHTLPDGVTVTSLTYREVRQKREYEPITCEVQLAIEPHTKLSSAWKYAEQAADAMLKHSTGR
tara:strand:+ start:11347 stop:12012 length:666 start_codon:yes stop_codon:yes gene_type:complete